MKLYATLAGVSQTVCLSGALLVLSLLNTQAASITNADNPANLNLPASWVLGTPAGPSDVAVWNNIIQLNPSKALGADTSWGGIQILDPAALITISAGNTLTLGASGIDTSLATQGLTLACPVVLGANQSWNVADTLTINGQLLNSTATVLTLTGGGTNNFSSTANGTYLGNISVNGGVLIPGGANANGNSAVGTGVITNNNGATLRSANKIVGNVLHFNGTSIIDANLGNFTMDGAWEGSGTVIITNMTSSSTVTSGGNGNYITNGGSAGMGNFTGSIIISSVNSDASTTAGSFRFNNGSPNNNAGNVNMSLNLGNGNAHFTEKNSTLVTATSFGALSGGPNTQLATSENYAIGGLGLNTTFAGTILGTSLLTKNGTGTFTLTGTNANTGITTVNAGILQIGDGVTSWLGALGPGAIVINGSGTLLYNRPDAFAITNAISGSGTLIKTNSNAMTYYGTNTASGTTLISQGALVLGPSGLMSCPVFVASGATFDLSQMLAQNPAFTLSLTLSGLGTVTGGSVPVAAAGGAISPGGSGAAGTLTFSTGLSESGTVNNVMELSSVGGANDLIRVVGDLTVSGLNTFTISPLGAYIPSGIYPLINYSGNFNGTLSSFILNVSGASGVLTNPPGQIAVIISPPARGPANLIWVGGGLNNWDTSSYDWVSGATPFVFQTGDNVRFDQSGAANSTVNFPQTVLPASVVVSNTTAYTFSGVGGIGGSGGLIKTNSGTLTVLTTNSYTGPTIIGGGTLAVSALANGTVGSGIGAASSNPTNLVLFGTTLAYTGPNASTDRGATLNGLGGSFDVPGGTTLELAGTLTGPGALITTDAGTLLIDNPNTYGGGTVLSNGVLALNSTSANNNGAGGSGLGGTTNAVTFYGGTLQLFGPETGINYPTLYNPLVVPAGQTGTLIMFPRGPVDTGPGSGLQSSLSGGGTLNLVVNYVRDQLSGNWSAFSGVINATAKNGGDEMRINNTYGYTNATINLNDGVTLDHDVATYSTNDIGALNGTSLAVIGPGTKSGAYPTYRVGWKGTAATFAGTISDDGSTTIIKVGTGTWTLSGYNLYTGPTYINSGTLAVNSLASTNIKVSAGATLDVTTVGSGTLSLATGQTLGGNGTVLGSVDTTGGGTIAPADPIGKLTVTGTVTLGGNAVMEINRDSSPSNDVLIAQSIQLGGTLTVENVGPELHIGDSFKLFSGTLAGNFTTLDLGYYTWNTSGLAPGGNGIITVTGLLPPPTLGVMVSGTNMVLSSSGGVPGGPLSFLTSTNVSAPLDTWTTFTNDVFGADGTYTLTIPIDTGTAQQFYALQHF